MATANVDRRRIRASIRPTYQRALALARVALGFVALSAGAAKLANPFGFLDTVYSYGLTGPDVGLAVASVLPWFEVTLGLALVFDVFSSGALVGLTACLAVFCWAQSSAIRRGASIDCGCFGSGGGVQDIVGERTLSRTAWLCALSASLLVARAVSLWRWRPQGVQGTPIDPARS